MGQYKLLSKQCGLIFFHLEKIVKIGSIIGQVDILYGYGNYFLEEV
tara:strand:+ start:25 stop:162 length:138 start_codon:yes stop_codon:yes gene_type:complete